MPQEINKVKKHRVIFDGKKITNTMRRMTGLPYGWKRIVWLYLHKFPVLRLLYNMENLVDDTLVDAIYPVCSTSVAYSFNKHGCDIVKFKSDAWMEPSDFARSPGLNYLFSLNP